MNEVQKTNYIDNTRNAMRKLMEGIAEYQTVMRRTVVMSALADDDFVRQNEGITKAEFTAATTTMTNMLKKLSDEEAQTIYRVI